MKKKIQFRFGVSEDSSRVHAGSVIAFALGNAQCPLKINKNFSLFCTFPNTLRSPDLTGKCAVKTPNIKYTLSVYTIQVREYSAHDAFSS